MTRREYYEQQGYTVQGNTFDKELSESDMLSLAHSIDRNERRIKSENEEESKEYTTSDILANIKNKGDK